VRDLAIGSLVPSANDAATALALFVGKGSLPRFVALMNEKARSLGMRDTHFASASGVIDRGNYSSAWDMAAHARYAMRSPRFRTVVATAKKRVDWAAPTNWKIYVNHNHLLQRYRGADGIKTGWTTVAGHCLVASASRGKVRLIAVVLGSADAVADTTRILDLGFRLQKT
jgi:D-alanyl-D-alanine carboxypeptidase (penicillin-binding protein 5/6)